MTLLPVLRALSRPLALLAVWLVVLGTALPLAAVADDGWCLGAGEDGHGNDAGGSRPHCDACIVVAAVPPADAPLPERPRDMGEAVGAPERLAPAIPCRTQWIRGPPKGS